MTTLDRRSAANRRRWAGVVEGGLGLASRGRERAPRRLEGSEVMLRAFFYFRRLVVKRCHPRTPHDDQFERSALESFAPLNVQTETAVSTVAGQGGAVMSPVTRVLKSSASPPMELEARAHAIKECLCVIVGLASTIERHVDDAARARVAQLLRASRSLSDLLTDARPCSAAKDEVRVADVVYAVVDRLTPEAEGRAVRLAVDCDGGTIVGDSSELAEALYNVASTALHASRPGSEVRIATRTGDDGDQEWTVEDVGCGISASLPLLVDAPGVSSRSGGTGLALSLALQVVHRHDGVMRVESAPSGTIVRMWLPAGRGAAVEAPVL